MARSSSTHAHEGDMRKPVDQARTRPAVCDGAAGSYRMAASIPAALRGVLTCGQ